MQSCNESSLVGQCQVKIIFQNNLLTVLNKHLRLDKLHRFCLITFPQLILFYCQRLTSSEAQTEQASRFLLRQDGWASRAQSSARPGPRGAANPAGASAKARNTRGWARALRDPSPLGGLLRAPRSGPAARRDPQPAVSRPKPALAKGGEQSPPGAGAPLPPPLRSPPRRRRGRGPGGSGGQRSRRRGCPAGR